MILERTPVSGNKTSATIKSWKEVNKTKKQEKETNIKTTINHNKTKSERIKT